MAGFDINNNGYQVERNGFQQNKIVGNEGKQGKKVEVDLNATHTTHKTETKEYGNELLTSSNPYYEAMGLQLSKDPMSLALKEAGFSPYITKQYGELSKETFEGLKEFTQVLDSIFV